MSKNNSQLGCAWSHLTAYSPRPKAHWECFSPPLISLHALPSSLQGFCNYSFKTTSLLIFFSIFSLCPVILKICMYRHPLSHPAVPIPLPSQKHCLTQFPSQALTKLPSCHPLQDFTTHNCIYSWSVQTPKHPLSLHLEHRICAEQLHLGHFLQVTPAWERAAHL